MRHVRRRVECGNPGPIEIRFFYAEVIQARLKLGTIIRAADLHGGHHADFVDAIKNGRRPNADIEEGFRSVALVHLGNLAVRLGRSLKFDPQTEQMVGDQEANALLGRTYREGHWAVPSTTRCENRNPEEV
jgi:hypothetical protein